MPATARRRISSGFFSYMVSALVVTSPPGHPVWCLYTFCSRFLPVKATWQWGSRVWGVGSGEARLVQLGNDSESNADSCLILVEAF
jgi:hypothetical protein